MVTAMIPLPAQLVRHHGIDLHTDFGVTHSVFTWSPLGDLYVLSTVFYNYRRYDPADNRDLTAHVITRFDPAGTVQVQAEIVDLMPAESGIYPIRHDRRAAIGALPDGTIHFGVPSNRSWVLEPDLHTVRTGYASDIDIDTDPAAPYTVNFAYVVRRTPGNRLLCLLGEPQMDHPMNLIAVSGPVTGLEHRPPLTAFGCVSSHIVPGARPSESFEFAHVSHGGRPVGRRNRPPRLADLVDASRAMRYAGGHIGAAMPLSDTSVVLAMTMTKGRKGEDFAVAVLDDTGTLRCRLDGPHGLDRRDDSPYATGGYSLAVDPVRQWILYLSPGGLCLFGADGTLQNRLPATSGLRPLARLKLAGVSPAGDLVLLDPERHLFSTVALPQHPHQLGPILTAALAQLPAQRRQLQKAHPVTNGHWPNEGSCIRHHLHAGPPGRQ